MSLERFEVKVFEAAVPGGTEDAAPATESGWEHLKSLDGTSWSSRWEPVTMRLNSVDYETGKPLAHTDLPWLPGGNGLVVRDAAIDLVRPVLSPYGEFLPLTCPDATLVLFNVTTVLEVLDEEHSEITRFSDGRIMGIESYAFVAEAIPERAVFKTPQENTGPILLTEPVVRDLEGLGLVGLGVRELWDSTTAPQ